MKEFKVGDKVYCLLYGEGEVTQKYEGNYTVGCVFDGCSDDYTSDGRIRSRSVNQCLFHLGEQPKMVYPEYEYQVLYKYKGNDRFHTSALFYRSVDEFIIDNRIEYSELMEKSKRVRKRKKA